MIIQLTIRHKPLWLLKKTVFIAFVLLLLIPAIHAQPGKNEKNGFSSKALIYPGPTKYATTLYISSATMVEGNMERFADHYQVTGSGQFQWQQEVTEAGEYEVALNYATHQNGASVLVMGGEDTIRTTLPVTQGVYADHKEWYQFNCERKLLKGKLKLSSGLNKILLQVNAQADDFETVVYGLDLLPLPRKDDAIAEVKKAQQVRPAMDWFSSMKYGVMFHWTSQTAPRSGNLKAYKEAVQSFDVQRFAKMVQETGADYVVFTANHADPHFPAPLTAWEKVHPGWTTERDLIAEIADELKKYNIRLFLYLATHTYANYDKVNSTEFEEINQSLLSEIGEHYQDKIAGYWFDGWYQSYQKHPFFDFERFYQTCKAGNPERVIALNSWLYPTVTVWQDYWAGEVFTPGVPPHDQILTAGPGKGLDYHGLLALEGGWVHTEKNTAIALPKINTKDLINYVAGCIGKGPVTINVLIYQDGTISEKAMEALHSLNQQISNFK